MVDLVSGDSLELFGFRLTGNALVPPDEPTLEDFARMAAYLGNCERVTRWALGDLLNAAEKRYGNTYSQLLDVTGLDYDTLRDCKWVSSRIEMSRRRDISWSHHREVAALDPDTQDELLERVVAENLTRAQLRTAIRELNSVVLESPPATPTPEPSETRPTSEPDAEPPTVVEVPPQPLPALPPPPAIPDGHVCCAACEGKGYVPLTLSERSGEVLLSFPCNGKPPEWELMAEQAEEWSQLYPGVDVLGECKKALAWVKANQKKTAKGMPRFLNAWLARANDRVRPGQRQQTGPTHQGIKDWLAEDQQ